MNHVELSSYPSLQKWNGSTKYSMCRFLGVIYPVMSRFLKIFGVKYCHVYKKSFVAYASSMHSEYQSAVPKKLGNPKVGALAVSAVIDRAGEHIKSTAFCSQTTGKFHGVLENVVYACATPRHAVRSVFANFCFRKEINQCTGNFFHCFEKT